MSGRAWWPQQLLIGWLNLVLTAPLIYLFIGLPLVLRQQGWSGADIGLLQLAGLPAMLKFLLAAPLDRWRLGRSPLARYRLWALILLLGYAAALLLLALNAVQESAFATLFALIMLASLLGTWADVPVNALAIQLLPASERVRAGALRSLSASLAAIIGGGLMLVLHARLGWAWPLLMLALAVASAMLLPGLLTSKEPGAASAPSTPARLRLRDGLSYFAASGHGWWAVLLVLYFPAVGAAWVYLKPLLLDQGFAPETIAWTVGVAGGLLAALGSLLGERLTLAYGARQTLPAFALGNLLVMLGLAGALFAGGGKAALLAASMALALAMGASAGLLFGLMMHHTRAGLAALDYGVQSSLFVASRSSLPPLAGLVLDRSGYSGLMLTLAAGLGVVCLVTWYARSRVIVGEPEASLR